LVRLIYNRSVSHSRGAARPPEDARQSQHDFALDRRLSIIIGSDRCLECLVIFGVFQRANDRLSCKAMAKGVAARGLLPFFRFRSCAFERITTIGLDLPV